MRSATTGVLAAFLCVACSGGGDDGGGSPPPPTTGAIRLQNATSYTIHEAYAAPSSSSSWGVQRNGSPIAPSNSFTVSNLAPGTWDARAVSIGTSSPFFAYGFDLPVVAGQTLEIFAENADFTGSVRVTNESAYAITAVYITPTEATTWGPNQLSEPLGSGASFLWYDVPPMSCDLRCDHSNGGTSTGTYTISPFSITSVICY